MYLLDGNSMKLDSEMMMIVMLDKVEIHFAVAHKLLLFIRRSCSRLFRGRPPRDDTWIHEKNWNYCR